MRPTVTELDRPGRRARAVPLARAVGVLAPVVVTSMSMTGCSGDDDQLTVFAAASLGDVVEELGDVFAESSGVELRVSTAGSSTLRLQLDEGAAADVFLPADAEQIERLDVAIDGDPTSYAANRLVVTHRVDGPVVGFDDFDDDALLLGACAPQVPCGGYAQRAFDSAGLDAALDTEEPDVRSVAAKVAEGELDAGLVYATDVLADERLVAVELPADAAADLEVEYAAVVLADAADLDTARRFVEFLTGDEATAILRAHGFVVP